MIGTPAGLCFDVSWRDPKPTGSAATATRGELYIELDGEPIWGDRTSKRVRGIPWSWVDLLEHLSRHWLELMWEEADPLGLLTAPQQLRTSAKRRWSRLSNVKEIEKEELALFRFEEAHNLAAALVGANAPGLWIVREGRRMLAAGDRVVLRSFTEMKATLEALGNTINERLLAVDDERAKVARENWTNRDEAPLGRVVSVATGLPQGLVDKIQGGRSVPEVWGLQAESPQPTAQLVAARMLPRELSPSAMSRVIDWIGSVPATASSDLDSLSSGASEYMRTAGTTLARAFERGHELALWLRSIPGIVSDSLRVDPKALLVQLGVRVDELDLHSSSLDAVACWDTQHGPAILVNLSGGHARGYEGRRATLAHELCHLLVDRHRSLPLAEVLGGRAPWYPEQRANAFAAEFLLPRGIAGTTLRKASDPSLEVEKLREAYGVSSEIIAWQALRSKLVNTKATLQYLLTLVSDPIQFVHAAEKLGVRLVVRRQGID